MYVVIDLCKPRRRLKEHLPAVYVLVLGAFAVKGWVSLW